MPENDEAKRYFSNLSDGDDAAVGHARANLERRIYDAVKQPSVPGAKKLKLVTTETHSSLVDADAPPPSSDAPY